jgi:uncharacterized protein with FMN-binding domain
MKRIALAVISTLAALVALFSYPTSTNQPLTTAAQPVSAATVVTQPGTSSATTTGQGPDPTPQLSGSAPLGTGSTADTTTAGQPSTGTVTVDGAAEMTRYGVVQVRVVITGGAISDVIAVQYPQQDRRDQQINSQAIPALRSEVMDAQSAHIDAVSGATYTSEGYITSLQSALDAAGFGQ